MSEHSSKVDLLRVAEHLGDLREEVVFVGGCAVVFLVPPVNVPSIRPTEDVDCIIKVDSRAQYYRGVVDRLRPLGFSECTDHGAPICRWVVEGIRVDIMPTAADILRFTNRWYEFALAEPVIVQATPDLRIRVIGLAAFLATKFEAFASRGQGEHAGDTDMEDILSVLAYRQDASQMVSQAPQALREFLQLCATKLLELSGLAELVSAALPGDNVSQSAVPAVLETLRTLAAGRGQ
ncbi:hypothetical protein IV102_17105 [bacterium]|nr:hypothetical protein [bacterium]